MTVPSLPCLPAHEVGLSHLGSADFGSDRVLQVATAKPTTPLCVVISLLIVCAPSRGFSLALFPSSTPPFPAADPDFHPHLCVTSPGLTSR